MSEIKGIRIGEVARRAGVPVSTVKHYYREGLLPEPVLKRKNSAYYSLETVERVQLIKQLQEDAFLPLRVVKDILKRTSNPREIRRYLPGRTGLIRRKAGDRVPAADVLKDDMLSLADLKTVAELGFITPHDDNGQLSYDRDDARLLAVLARLRRLGLTPERGFSFEQLAAYREHIRALVRMELTMALEGLVGRMPADDLRGAGAQIADAATELVAVLHRKEVTQALGVVEDDE